MPVSRDSKVIPCHHGLRRQTIVQSLLADVFQGRLRAGAHLVTQELADRFGVSHTPIREALITLAGIGIIDLLPNRGAVVRRVTPHEVREVCQVRRVLECEAARSACGRIDLAELHALADELRRMTTVKPRSGTRFIEEARAVDSRLHDLIAESCGNAFLAQEISRLKMLFRAFRDVAWERDGARNDFHRLDRRRSRAPGDRRGALGRRCAKRPPAPWPSTFAPAPATGAGPCQMELTTETQRAQRKHRKETRS